MASPTTSATAATSESKHTDLNIPHFIPPVDAEESAIQWKKWRRNFERKLRFFRVTTLQDKLDALSIYGGEDIDELVDNLPQIPDEQVTVDANEQINDFHRAIAKLDHHFTPMLNKDSARSVFEQMTQGDLTMAKYYVALKKQAEKCQFADADDAIRSKILQSMNDKRLRREAMLKSYDLSSLLRHAANKEDVERQAASMEKTASEQVNKVYEQRKIQSKSHRKYRPPPNKSEQPQGRQNRKPAKKCSYCGGDHAGPRSNCPASGKTCAYCKKKGHFAVACKSKGRSRADHVGEEITSETEESSDDYAFSISSNKKRPTVAVLLNGVKGRMDADSCSSVNIMDQEQYEKIVAASKNPINLTPVNNTNLFAYGQEQPITLKGKFTAAIQSIATGKETNAEILVMENKANSRPLMSLETGTKLGLIHIANSVETHDGYWKMKEDHMPVFNGLGKHKTIKARFIIDQSVQPTVQRPRKVPYNLMKQVQEEEDRLINMNIIEPVPDTEPTTWCTNPVIAPKKNGKIRFCSNMRAPNLAIKRPISESMTVEDVKLKLGNARVFSKLDMNEAYHQIELAEESRHITTFYGTRQRLRYKRLNYGAVSSQDIFDKAMDDTIHGLKNVIHIRDDFVVYGINKEEHDEAINALLQRFQKSGLTLSAEKCQFGVKEIEFFGLKFTDGTVCPAKSKIEALEKMSEPKNTSEVRSFLGMAQYSAQFIPNFSETSTPLRKLTHKTATWRWETEERNAFNKIRTALSSEPVLGYYEVGRETRLAVDAGPHGLGLVLLQKQPQGWKAVFNASRSLTATEERYSQLEREALAIRWACERCYTYLIGSKFMVITDHEPLLPYFRNPNKRPTLRIERWLMYLQQFDFQIEYRPGKENIADYLSRHAIPISQRDLRKSTKYEETVRLVLQNHVAKSSDNRRDKSSNKGG